MWKTTYRGARQLVAKHLSAYHCSIQNTLIRKEKQGIEQNEWYVSTRSIKKKTPVAGVGRGLSAILRTERSLVQFPVRAHAWVVGKVPSWGGVRGNQPHIDVSLPLFFSPFPLSKNK